MLEFSCQTHFLLLFLQSKKVGFYYYYVGTYLSILLAFIFLGRVVMTNRLFFIPLQGVFLGMRRKEGIRNKQIIFFF